MSFVRFENVDLAYAPGGALAVQGLNLDIAEGEFVAVVGPSGCGKSTLMKLASGLRPPSNGYVFVDGREVGGPLKIVGMAFQAANLLPWRSTLDNVMLPLEIVEPHRGQLRKQRAEYEAQARALLARVGLDGYADKHPWELSGGMQQRASICRALIHQPRLLMLDEPFGALDAFTREQMQTLLLEVWRHSGRRIFLITHDIEEALFLATELVLMSPGPGRIVERIEPGFSRRWLAGEPVRALKSDPAFIALREHLLDTLARHRQAHDKETA